MTVCDRPRLLVVSSTYPRWAGDPEPGFVHELARHLTGRYEVVVLCPRSPGASSEEVLDGVRVIRFGYAPRAWECLVHGGGMATNLRRHRWMWLLVPLFALSQSLSLARCLRRYRPHVLHVHWIIPQTVTTRFASILCAGLPPVLVTSHGADLFAFRGMLATAVKRWALRAAGGVTVVSEAMRAPMAELGVPRERIAVEPMGVDFEHRFVPPPGGLRSSTDVVFVGRLVEKKGLPLLIEAMASLAETHPQARLRVAGFGPDEQACRRQVERLGLTDRVEFLGPVSQDDLPSLYQRAAVCVAPFVESASGDQEGLGLVVLEALGCGCPVVAGRVRATADLQALSRDGIVVVDPRRTDELAAAIRQCFDAPAAARRQASRGRDALRGHMSWPQVANRYADRLDSLRVAGSGA